MADETRNLTFELRIDGVDSTLVRVHRFEIREELSGLMRGYVVVAAGEIPAVEDLLGQKAALIVKPDDTGADDRYFHGLVFGADIELGERGGAIIEIELAAAMATLELRANWRIFRELNVPDVVKKILKEHDLTDADTKWSLSGSYAVRDTISQQNETDYAFVSRILADEGIGFAIRNEKKMAKIVFFDDDKGYTPVAGDGVLYDRDATRTRENVVEGLEETRAAGFDAVAMRDYDFKRPALDLSVTETAPSPKGRELYLHPGGYTESADGKRRAKRTLERLRSHLDVLIGRSDLPGAEPGRVVTIASHPREAANEELAIWEVVHRGGIDEGNAVTGEEGKGQAGAVDDKGEGTQADPGGGITYDNVFVATPSGVPFRPESAFPTPVPGKQFGFVTGPSGQELHGNDFGQVKLRFPWDREGITDDKSSRWLRVGQLALGGSMVTPRVDFEVTVDHEMGQLDRPFVHGHLYNGEKMPPYELPAGATRSSIQTATTSGGPGANEMRFEDAAGAEEMFFNASFDYTVSVEHDAMISVINDQKVQVGANNQDKTVANRNDTVSIDRSLTVSGSQSLKVNGDYSEAIGASSSISIGGVRDVTVGGDHMETTAGTLSRSVGGLEMVTAIGGFMRKIVGSSRATVGAAWAETCAGSRASNVGGNRIETIGALKMVKAKTISISTGAVYGMNAASETVKCGGNRTDKATGALALSAGGGLSVKADSINISGEDKVVFRVGGTTIEVTPSGVKIKSSTIDLKGTKQMAAMMHKSG